MGFEVRPEAVAPPRRTSPPDDDVQRLFALHQLAAAAPGIALATGAGHGLARLLDGLDWRRLASSVERGTRWVGHGEVTLLQLGLLAHAGAGSWSGPMACSGFGGAAASAAEAEAAEITRACFAEAMDGSLEAVGFRTAPGFDGLAVRGPLWGGSLPALLSVLGTRHWPTAAVRGGVLLIEDLEAEGSVRVERGLLQLRQAGVLQGQRAVLLGLPAQGRLPAADRGLSWADVLLHVRQGLKTPLLAGLPSGPRQPRLTLPLGRRVQLVVQGREVLILW